MNAGRRVADEPPGPPGLSPLARLLQEVAASPARAVAASFVALIAAGTLLLMLPLSSRAQGPMPFVDALFTATSACCVTGLIVVDTGKYFTAFGQVVILLLIQLGGLGIMTLSAFVGLLVRRRLSLRSSRALRDILDLQFSQEATAILWAIVRLTLAFEAAGAAVLLFVFVQREPTLARAAYSAVFHSVSAFCNAGFSLYSDSMTAFRGSLLANATMAGLIVAGGLGFVVLRDVYGLARARLRGERQRMSVQTRLMLYIAGALIFGGALAFALAERGGVLRGLDGEEAALAALFQSITARTAGFNTVDISALGAPALLLLICLMIIGAGPGSTGGGIKTSTVGIILASVRSMVSRREDVEIFRRRLPPATVRKAFVVAAAYLGYLVLGLGLLLVVEHASKARFLDMFFEAVSAMGTVGLSTGVTPTLSPAGRLVVVALMYGGRVGPLTLVAAMGQPAAPPAYRYAEEPVMIG